MFSEIAEIKSIREQKSRLSEREKELTDPMLTDLNMIGQLYEWFKEILVSRNCPGRVDSVTQRKKFIFIVLYLYSPSTLAGGKMLVGLRDAIAEAVQLKDKAFISRNVKVVAFRHQYDKYFRQDVDWIYGEMITKLKLL